MDQVIIDTLHLFLRIYDILIENLIRELRRADAIDEREVFHGKSDLNKHCHIDGFLKFLNFWNISFA